MRRKRAHLLLVSVSSNGSLGLKPSYLVLRGWYACYRFSILERIVGVETGLGLVDTGAHQGFSILERIVGVETARHGPGHEAGRGSFSILERIVGVETQPLSARRSVVAPVSVSSNGSLGLKPDSAKTWAVNAFTFQYPRTDRWG